MKTTKFWATLFSTSGKPEITTLFVPVVEMVREEDELIPYILYGNCILSVRSGYFVHSLRLIISEIFFEHELKTRYKLAVTQAFDFEPVVLTPSPVQILVECDSLNLPKLNFKVENGEMETNGSVYETVMDEINFYFLSHGF